MIDFKFNSPNAGDSEGSIYVSLNNGSENYYDKNQLPLHYLVKSLSGQVVWHSELFPGNWSMYSEISCTTAEIIDSLGNEILKWKWHPFVNGDLCHQKFYIWALKNRGANGIAVGTHNGMSGEWVIPVNSGLLKATLVEASEPQYSDLEKFYTAKKWITCRKLLVSTNGQELTFYEGLTNGQTNSISESTIRKHLSDNLIVPVLRPSISINQLISETSKNGDIKWLHLDLEGMDGEIIYSIDRNFLPEVLIFESLHMTTDYYNDLCEYLKKENYEIIKSNWNTICTKIISF